MITHKPHLISIGLILLLKPGLTAQSPIDIMQSTIKIAALTEEEFYYGFAEGDQLIFNFEELNRKELKELAITELPNSSKFMDYKTKKIENKTLIVSRTAIYKFRFSNSALGGRICRIKVQRIPIGESSKNFNTTVYWRTLYDTVSVPRQETFLERSDTVATTLIDQIAKISSMSALSGKTNKNLVDFSLPSNTISWSYYVGVGKEGKEAYEKAKDGFLNSASASVIEIPGYGIMGALALSGLSFFSKVHGNDNVRYYFITDWDNVQLFKSDKLFFQYKQGDVVNDASQMKYPLTGKVYLGLLNDNIIDPIDVIVKVVAIQVNQKWGTRTVIEKQINSRQEGYLIK